MKKLLIFILAAASGMALFIPGMTWAQTSLEEYNYCKKGYKIQIESGLDMKKGYQLKNYPLEHYANNIKFDVKFLVRDNENKPCGTLIIAKQSVQGFANNVNTKDIYFCVPSFGSDKQVWDLYAADLNSQNKDMLFALSWVLSQVMNYHATGIKK